MNQKDRERLTRLNFKSSILAHYGNGKLACVKCGFSDIRALSIDHIDGKGVEHRKSLRRGGVPFYKWLVDNGYPEGYQTLCMNCQFIKSYRQDIPMSKTTSVARRVQLWVDLREKPFSIRDIMIGLGLLEAKRLSVRVALCRLGKSGVIKKHTWRGSYKKCVKPIKLFGRTLLDNVAS